MLKKTFIALAVMCCANQHFGQVFGPITSDNLYSNSNPSIKNTGTDIQKLVNTSTDLIQATVYDGSVKEMVYHIPSLNVKRSQIYSLKPSTVDPDIIILPGNNYAIIVYQGLDNSNQPVIYSSLIHYLAQFQQYTNLPTMDQVVSKSGHIKCSSPNIDVDAKGNVVLSYINDGNLIVVALDPTTGKPFATPNYNTLASNQIVLAGAAISDCQMDWDAIDITAEFADVPSSHPYHSKVSIVGRGNISACFINSNQIPDNYTRLWLFETNMYAIQQGYADEYYFQRSTNVHEQFIAGTSIDQVIGVPRIASNIGKGSYEYTGIIDNTTVPIYSYSNGMYQSCIVYSLKTGNPPNVQQHIMGHFKHSYGGSVTHIPLNTGLFTLTPEDISDKYNGKPVVASMFQESLSLFNEKLYWIAWEYYDGTNRQVVHITPRHDGSSQAFYVDKIYHGVSCLDYNQYLPAVAGHEYNQITGQDKGQISYYGDYSSNCILTATSDQMMFKYRHAAAARFKEKDAIISNHSRKIYPNPAEKEIMVTYSRINRVDIYNVSGQIVLTELSQGVDNITVDIAKLPSGVYIVNIQGDRGSSVEKFIKK